jgi:hypothetical protein
VALLYYGIIAPPTPLPDGFCIMQKNEELTKKIMLLPSEDVKKFDQLKRFNALHSVPYQELIDDTVRDVKV